MMEENIHIFPTIEKLAEYFSVRIARSITETASRPFYIAFSGGSTPREIFRFLAENYYDKIKWSRVMIFWGDERCVSPSSDESNFRMAYESLIKNISIPGSNIYRIEAEKDPADEAVRYSGMVGNLLPHKNNLPRFDMVMLGMGEDGHTASIFPGHINLFHSEKLFDVSEHPATKQKRITATGRLINNSKEVCFLVTGANKAERVSQVLQKKPGWENLPASLVKPNDGRLEWILDAQAGQKLIEEAGSSRGSDHFQSS